MTSDKNTQVKMTKIMEIYGEDKWWISDNSDYMSYRQFQEDNMLIESHAWQTATEKLLNREISFIEFKVNFTELKKEVIEQYENKYLLDT